MVENERKAISILLGVCPSLVGALIPKCPLCAIAFLSLLGVAVDLHSKYLLLGVFLFLGIGLLEVLASWLFVRDYRRLLMQLAAFSIMALGKLVFSSTAIVSVGIAMFVGALVWKLYFGRRLQCHAASCNVNEIKTI